MNGGSNVNNLNGVNNVNHANSDNQSCQFCKRVAQSPKVGDLGFRRGWGRQIARLNARPSPYLRGQVGSMENIVKIVNSLQED